MNYDEYKDYVTGRLIHFLMEKGCSQEMPAYDSTEIDCRDIITDLRVLFNDGQRFSFDTLDRYIILAVLNNRLLSISSSFKGHRVKYDFSLYQDANKFTIRTYETSNGLLYAQLDNNENGNHIVYGLDSRFKNIDFPEAVSISSLVSPVTFQELVDKASKQKAI